MLAAAATTGVSLRPGRPDPAVRRSGGRLDADLRRTPARARRLHLADEPPAAFAGLGQVAPTCERAPAHQPSSACSRLRRRRLRPTWSATRRRPGRRFRLDFYPFTIEDVSSGRSSYSLPAELADPSPLAPLPGHRPGVAAWPTGSRPRRRALADLARRARAIGSVDLLLVIRPQGVPGSRAGRIATAQSTGAPHQRARAGRSESRERASVDRAIASSRRVTHGSMSGLARARAADRLHGSSRYRRGLRRDHLCVAWPGES